jgi:hypothetical protein
VTLRSVARGQEFVTDASAEVQDWLRALVQEDFQPS